MDGNISEQMNPGSGGRNANTRRSDQHAIVIQQNLVFEGD